MNKKQRIRWEIGAGYRAGASGTTTRQDHLQGVRNRYDLSTGLQQNYAIFIHGPSS